MLSEKDFLILDAIDRHKPTSQRALARYSGVSLGKTNNVLKKLVERGLVRTSNLKGSVRKRHNPYLLTHKGLETKTQLTFTFVKARMREFEEFRDRLLENLMSLEEQGVKSLLVLGSENLGRFLGHIARRESLDIRIIGTVSVPEDFESFAGDSYDSILIAEDPKRYDHLLQAEQIPAERVAYLK